MIRLPLRLLKIMGLSFALVSSSLLMIQPAQAATTYTGTEDTIVDITPITAASILTFSYTGEGVFTASPVDATGNEGLSYMLQIGDFNATYLQTKPTKPIVALAIKGTGEWSITIDSYKKAAPINSKAGSGTGTTVVNLGKPTSGIKRITWSHTGDGVFSVSPVDAKGKSRFPLFLKIGAYTGTVMLPSGIQYFEIKASGDWKFSIK
jgi:hypothetical protein